MTKTVEIEIDDQQLAIELDLPTGMEKMYLAAKAPSDLLDVADEVDDPDEIDDVDVALTPDIIDYFVNIVTETTRFEKDQVEQLPTEQLIHIGSAVLEAVWGEEEQDNSAEKRIKRVRLTEQFMENLFRGECAMVAGLPDDISMENFHYDPSRNELQFIFSSDEWDKVKEAATIPATELYQVEIQSNDKEL